MISAYMADGSRCEHTVQDNKITVNVLEKTAKTYLELCFTPGFECDTAEYVFLPACCYNGNKFKVLKKEYPPFLTVEESQIDLPITITDVPRLNQDGSGAIEVTTGDVSVPCIGVYSIKAKKATLLFTTQGYSGINIGLAYEQGKMMLRWPYYRKKAYRHATMLEGVDEGRCFLQGEQITIAYKLFEFDCESMEDFYHFFAQSRKCMGMDDTRPAIMPLQKQWEIQRDKFNYQNWYHSANVYGNTAKADKPKYIWQAGWCGGSNLVYAMMKLGGELEQERALKTLDFMYKTQKKCGFLVETTDWFGTETPHNWKAQEPEYRHTLRMSADALFFTFKTFKVMKKNGVNIPKEIEMGAKKLADAFVALWNEYGQFGQFLDTQTGKLSVGGSTACAVAPAGLCGAYEWFGQESYLKVAIESALAYYKNDAKKGYTTGGPGEILQCPDSESCAGLLESLVTLYEVTQEDSWINKAKFLADMCASWTFAYNFSFPSKSEFGRLDMRTIGSVFANVQNKHSAPGICTLSGDSLYRLYKYTDDILYKELFEDIVLTVNQYLSTDERPIYGYWGVPFDSEERTHNEEHRLLSGYMCERVNTSDWEGVYNVGAVFNGSCWCEVTNLLILAECMNFID